MLVSLCPAEINHLYYNNCYKLQT